jgi:hypothetical protein
LAASTDPMVLCIGQGFTEGVILLGVALRNHEREGKDYVLQEKNVTVCCTFEGPEGWVVGTACSVYVLVLRQDFGMLVIRFAGRMCLVCYGVEMDGQGWCLVQYLARCSVSSGLNF